MSNDRLIYGKEVRLKGHTIVLQAGSTTTVTSPLVLQGALTSTADITTTGTLTGANMSSPLFSSATSAVSGAIVLASAVSVHVDKLGGQLVRVQVRPEAIKNIALVATGSTTINATAVVPISHRPTENTQIKPCLIYINGAYNIGLCEITTAGDLVIYASQLKGNFVSGQTLALVGTVDFMYKLT